MNIEHRYLNKISAHLYNFRDKGTTYQLRCPYCQSTGRSKKGKRITDATAKGYFYSKTGCLNFKCHKCGTGRQFHNFLKDHFPNVYLDYVKERELHGTTGKETNCPTFANALESIGGLQFEKPIFNKNENDDSISTTARESSDSSKEEGCGKPPKVQRLQPMRSPQQQSGHQGPINHLIKQKHERARRRRGDLW